MRLKRGVKQEGVQAPIWYAIGIAEMIYASLGVQLVVTSLCDGKHGANSLHYNGLAVDIRTRNLSQAQIEIVLRGLSHALDGQIGFDVILEKDHIHIEYEPKKGEGWQVAVA